MSRFKKILRLCAFTTALYIFAGGSLVANAQLKNPSSASQPWSWGGTQQTGQQSPQTQAQPTAPTQKAATQKKATLSVATTNAKGQDVSANPKAQGSLMFGRDGISRTARKGEDGKTSLEKKKVLGVEKDSETGTYKVKYDEGDKSSSSESIFSYGASASTPSLASRIETALTKSEDECADAKPLSSVDALVPNAAGLFDGNNTILTDMQAMLYKMYKTFGLLFMVGHGLLCYATYGDGLLKLTLSFTLPFGALFIPNWNLLFSGLIIYLFTAIMAMAIGLYFVDISFKLGFAILMLPVSIGLWPFKPTSKKLSENFSMIVHNAMLFTFMSIGVSICIVLIMNGVFSGGVFNWDEFWESLEQGNTKKMVENFSLFSMHTLIMAFCIIYGLKIMASSIDDYLKSLFRDSVFSSESPMHHLGTQAFGMATEFAVKPVLKVAGSVAVRQTGELISGLGESISKLGSYEGREGLRQTLGIRPKRRAISGTGDNPDDTTPPDTTGGGSHPIIPDGSGTPPNPDTGSGQPTAQTETPDSESGQPTAQPEIPNKRNQRPTASGGKPRTREARDNTQTPAEDSAQDTQQPQGDPNEPVRRQETERKSQNADKDDYRSNPEDDHDDDVRTGSGETETPDQHRSSVTEQQSTDGTKKGGFKEALEEFDRLESIKPSQILGRAVAGTAKAFGYGLKGGVEITKLTLITAGHVIGGTVETTLNVVTNPRGTYKAIKEFAEVSKTERKLQGQSKAKFYSLKAAKALTAPLWRDVLRNQDTSVVYKAVQAIAASKENKKDNTENKEKKPSKYYLKQGGKVVLRTVKGTGEDSAKLVGDLLQGFGKALIDSAKEKQKTKKPKSFLDHLTEKTSYQEYLEAQEDRKRRKEDRASYFSSVEVD